MRPFQHLNSRSPALIRSDWRIGLVGCGNMAHEHVKACRRLGIRIVACTDIEVSRALAMAEKCQAEVCATVQELCERPDLDFLIVAIGSEGRVELTQTAFTAGKPVLIEKPLAYSLADARAMVAAADRAGVFFAVSQNSRWLARYRMVTECIQSGLIGEPFQILLARYGDQDRHVKGWVTREERYMSFEWGAHHFDLLRKWAGREPVSVCARTAKAPGQQFAVDTLAGVMVDFGAPLVAMLQHSEAAAQDGEEQILRIFGAEGTIRADPLEILTSEDRGAWRRPELGETEWLDGVGGSITEFANALAEGREPEHSGRDNLGTVKTCLAAFESARRGGEKVRIEEVE